jgi:Fe-Mn family superoxide dismutase
MTNSVKTTIAATLGTSLFLDATRAHGNTPVTPTSFTGDPFAFKQIALPYAPNALEPVIDTMTMEIHYGKHHAAYIKNVNEAIVAENVAYQSEQAFFDNMSTLSAKIRNNAGGAWNHNFFWQVMKPGGGGTPNGKVTAALEGTFGSVAKFTELFNAAAMGRFGSGWAWLIKDASGKLVITSTPNQDNPLMNTAEVKGTPVLGLDVWEHAYYLKYQNKRNEYVSNWWNVVNWDEVASRLG